MANIKLKDLLNEISTQGGMISHNPWVNEEEKDEPKVDVKELVSKINSFNSIGESIYGKGNLKEVAENLSSIAEGAAQHTLSEVDDMFDKITVSRNMKELTGLSKQFGKVASEANSLQERMSGLYEDMGHILGRYYSIGEGHVTGHDDEDRDVQSEADKMMFREEDDYKAFFKKAMKKFNVSNIEDMDDGDKKDFFNYVDRNYKAKNENQENRQMTKLKELLEEGPAELKSLEKMMLGLMDMSKKLKDIKQRKQLSVVLSAAHNLRNMLK